MRTQRQPDMGIALMPAARRQSTTVRSGARGNWRRAWYNPSPFALRFRKPRILRPVGQAANFQKSTPMPFRLDTPFRKKARQLAAPNREDFDLTDWSAALAEGEATVDDTRLMATAIWLQHQARTLRDYFAAKPLPKLSAKLSVTLAVAMLNRENAVMGEKANKARLAARKAGGMATDFLTHISIKRNDGTFEVDSSSFTDAAVDGTDSWIYDVFDKHEPQAQQANLGNTAVRYVQHYSLRRSHYDIWQRAI